MKLIIEISDKEYEFIKNLQHVILGRGTTKTVQYNVINAIKNGIPYESATAMPINVERIEYGTDELPYKMWVSNGNLMEVEND